MKTWIYLYLVLQLVPIQNVEPFFVFREEEESEIPEGNQTAHFYVKHCL